MTAHPGPVLALIDAFRLSKAMFAAVALGIFDRLHERPASLEELAAALRADAGALERLLDSCVALEFLAKTDGTYRSLPVADTYLRRSSPQTLAGYILYSNRVLYPMWGRLEDAVREGTSRWDQIFGGRDALFANFYKDEQAKREFLAGMHSFGLLSSPPVVEAFDLSRFRRLVDLGGGTGHLASAARARYPHLQAAVFDLPEVLPVAREYAEDSVELLAGDFFRDDLPEADLFALGRILHDWGEPRIVELLRKVYERLPEGGGLLLAERLLDDDKSGPVPALMQSLNMLVCTEGKERSLQEYRALLQDAGFRHVEGHRTGTPLDAVLAVKG